MVLVSRGFCGVFAYRLERALFLLTGRLYPVLRLLLLPLILLMGGYSNCDISYHARIGKGLRVLHPSLGVVVSGKAVIGDHLTLVGGNCIGVAARRSDVPFVIGSHVEMGANATIIGPLTLGDRIHIGANACVVKSHPGNDLVLVGNPATPRQRRAPAPTAPR